MSTNYSSRFLIPFLLVAMAGVFAVLLQSCEEPFDLGISDERDEIVVEGYIEYSPDSDISPYVILSRSFPIYRNHRS
jgi:hypothetical protein